MSFNKLILAKIEEIRRRLISDMLDACDASKDSYAFGRLRRRQGKGPVEAKATYGDEFIVQLHPRAKWTRLSSLDDGEIVRLGKLRWEPANPYHALEVLAKAADTGVDPEYMIHRDIESALRRVHQQSSDEASDT
jgi:hypothetical protein